MPKHDCSPGPYSACDRPNVKTIALDTLDFGTLVTIRDARGFDIAAVYGKRAAYNALAFAAVTEMIALLRSSLGIMRDLAEDAAASGNPDDEFDQLMGGIDALLARIDGEPEGGVTP